MSDETKIPCCDAGDNADWPKHTDDTGFGRARRDRAAGLESKIPKETAELLDAEEAMVKGLPISDLARKRLEWFYSQRGTHLPAGVTREQVALWLGVSPNPEWRIGRPDHTS